MKRIDRRTFPKLTTGAAVLATTTPAASQPLAATDVFTSDIAGTFVDSTVILGERSAALIDA